MATSLFRNESHDEYGVDAEERISPSEWRCPRLVLLTWIPETKVLGLTVRHGSWSFAELDIHGLDCETTLTGRVLREIEQAASRVLAGTVTVDGIVYAFACSVPSEMLLHWTSHRDTSSGNPFPSISDWRRSNG